MAFWDKLSSRGNVEDRRGMGPTAVGGGVGVVGLILYLVINYAATGRIDTTAILSGLQHAQVSTQSVDTKQFNGADSYEVFVSTVLGSTNDMWQKTFAANNKTYTPPALVLFRGSTHSSKKQRARLVPKPGPTALPKSASTGLLAGTPQALSPSATPFIKLS